MSIFFGNMTVKIYDEDGTEQMSMAVKKIEITRECEDFYVYAGDPYAIKRIKNVTIVASTNNQ